MNTRSLFCAAFVFSGFAFAAGTSEATALDTKDLLNTGTSSAQAMQLSDDIQTAAPNKKAPMIVVVDKEKHITHVLQTSDGKLVDVCHVPDATGKKTTPTPEGRMKVIDKRWDPIWKPPVSIDPAQKQVESFTKNPHNPLGVAWLGLSEGCIGLHGTCSPNSIGKNASHGCVRHRNEDIKKLFGLVPVGTPVYIVSKFAGTKLLADDVDYLNGGTTTQMVAHADLNETLSHI